MVALGVWGSEWGIETPLVMDEGEEEDSGDEGIGTGAGEYKCNTPGFIAKVEQLIRIFGAVKYPVNVLAALNGDAKKGHLEPGAEICSLEDVCPKCDEKYAHLKSVHVTALVPVGIVDSAVW